MIKFPHTLQEEEQEELRQKKEEANEAELAHIQAKWEALAKEKCGVNTIHVQPGQAARVSSITTPR